MDTRKVYVASKRPSKPTYLDIILYMIHVAGDKIVSKTKLEKMVYLVQRDGIDLGLDFNVSHYGPSSDKLGKGLLTLDVASEIQESLKPSGKTGCIYTHEYKLTSLGKMVAKSVGKKLNPEEKTKIDNIIRKWKDQPKNEIIAHTTPLWLVERDQTAK